MSLFQRHRGFLQSLLREANAKRNARSRQQKPIKCAQRNGVKCHETKRARSTENHSKIKTL